MKQIDLREGARRQHRSISLFCVIQCWLHGWDGIQISRDVLERLIGLERFKYIRLVWMSEDFKEFFPYQEPDYQQNHYTSFFSVKISRLPFEKKPQIGKFQIWNHPDDENIAKLYEGFMPFFADAANYDERLLASYLSLLTQGQISPQLIPPVKEENVVEKDLVGIAHPTN
ncbi:MAG: hypothetical protein ABII09_11640 [Planctomycetota bacterium]